MNGGTWIGADHRAVRADASDGHLRPARVLRLPDVLTQLSARMGDAVPGIPWCTETLSMLGSDNVGNPAVFEQLLGRKGVHYSQLVATAWR